MLIPKIPLPKTFSDYRPITLLNTDYKIFSKIICSRIKTSSDGVFGIGQTCSLPGKNIFHNLTCVRDVIHFYEKQPSASAALLTIDLEQAFDRISHSYLFDILQYIGVPQRLLDCLQACYNNSSSALLINGHFSQAFPNKRGTRQGCPLSMVLFNLVIETLIRSTDHVLQGLCVNNNTIISRSYADDLYFLITQPSEIPEFMKLLSDFEDISGAKINLLKSKYLPLGSWMVDYGDIITAFPKANCLKILGLTFFPSIAETARYNWNSITNKVHQSTISNLSRRLTLFQKVWFLNTYFFSKIWFTAKILLPRKQDTQKIEKFAGFFLWKGYPYRIAREQLRLPYKLGGVGLINVSCKSRAILVKMCHDIVNNKADVFEIAYFSQFLDRSSPLFK